MVSLKILTNGIDPALDAVISAFYEKHSNFRIEKVSVDIGPGDNFEEKFNAKLNDSQPDLAPLNNIKEMVENGKVLALDPYIQKHNFDLQPFGPMIEQLRVDGKLYDLPYMIYPQVIAYNKQLFQEANVPPPTDSWTWDQFREAARMTTKGDGDAKVWGISSSFPESLARIMVTQLTGSPVQAEEKDLKEALQFFSTMLFSDKSMRPAERRDPNATSFIVRNNDFQEGKAAMSLQSVSSLQWLGSSLKFELGVAPMPTVPGGKVSSQVYPQGYGILATSKQPDAAFQFLSFLTGEEGAKALAKSGTMPVYRSPAVQKAWFERNPAPPAETEFLFKTDWFIFPRTETPSLSVAQQMSRALNQTLSGEKPWEEAVAEFVREVEKARTESNN